jgi:hypothetical protein
MCIDLFGGKARFGGLYEFGRRGWWTPMRRGTAAEQELPPPFGQMARTQYQEAIEQISLTT